MKKILVATTNLHKLAEIKAIFAQEGMADWQIVSLADYPQYAAPEENGKSFAENAMLKAIDAAKMSGLLTLADDSGLTVDALDGAPGIHSARYAVSDGFDHNDAANRAKLLSALADTEDENRTAAFVCAAALATPDGDAVFIEGCCEGVIAKAERGANGFGYDSLFYLPRLGRTMAELDSKEKNGLSHRSIAMRKIAGLLNCDQ